MTSPVSLFVSHGAPDLILQDTEARDFLKTAAESFSRPKGIVMASAHFETSVPSVVRDPQPEMIYDFGGFDPRLRQIVYPAPGSAELAGKVSGLLEAGGIDHQWIEKRGFDHGTWVPLALLYPDADIPVVQISVQPSRSAAHHYQMGKALRPLSEEGYLIIGSGAMTHNLGELFGPMGLKHERRDGEISWARTFAEWVKDQIVNGNHDALIDYERAAPFAAKNHPTSEHFLPLFVALGASTKAGKRLHKSTEFAILAMDAYAFH